MWNQSKKLQNWKNPFSLLSLSFPYSLLRNTSMLYAGKKPLQEITCYPKRYITSISDLRKHVSSNGFSYSRFDKQASNTNNKEKFSFSGSLYMACVNALCLRNDVCTVYICESNNTTTKNKNRAKNQDVNHFFRRLIFV